jgi:hypothetical protein
MTKAAPGRKWTQQRRQKHSNACKNKPRLTTAQKLAIIRAAEEHRPGCNPPTQTEVAKAFMISRMTVSKLLRPDSTIYRLYLQHLQGGSMDGSATPSANPPSLPTSEEVRMPVSRQSLSPWMAMADCRPTGLRDVVK